MRQGKRRLYPGKLLVLGVLAGVLATAVGCGSTIEGQPVPAGGGSRVDTNFDKLLRECEVVPLDQIGKAIESQAVSPSFNGAVCMWDVQGSSGGDAMLTLNWYENGSLPNEKANNDRLGYRTDFAMMQETRVMLTHRPSDGDACGASAAAADSGVVGWWVNYQPGPHPDPCGPAQKLLDLTLNRAR